MSMVIMKGIYQYRDLKTNEIVYIGKDSNIDKHYNRHSTHKSPAHYNDQPFNRALQNNLERYAYEIIYAGDFSSALLNVLEINTISEFKLSHNGERPKFNYTDGGDGQTPSFMKTLWANEEYHEKVSENMKKSWTDEKREYYRKRMLKDNPMSNKQGDKSPHWKDYARIIKAGKNGSGNQQYAIIFNGVRLKRTTNYNKLVKWFEENYPNEELKT